MARVKSIEVRGARVHNLKDVNVSIPLNQVVGIAGVSGSGKSSLALGVLYAEGSRRYMEALSTYTRRRISQSGRAQVDEVLHVPAALALRQRPGIPGVRSTFGTSTELLNHLRLLFSRLGSHRCPNGHYVPPTMNVALEQSIVCPTCGVEFYGPGAESLAFNSDGACPECAGTGTMRQIDESTLVPNPNKTIDEGAVAPWGHLMWSLMKDIARQAGIRTDVPYKDLTAGEQEFVLHGAPDKYHLLYHNEKTGTAGEMDFTYYSAYYSVENALSKVKDEKGLKRVARYLREMPCSACGGSRLSDAARAPLVRDINLAQASAFTLDELTEWIAGVPASMPEELRSMAQTIVDNMVEPMDRLRQLGLGYLALDRASSTLSTGERQRAQLSRAVRNRTTGVLYVLDEPSIGLHPANVDGLLGVMDDLVADGNSVVVVDHDVRLLRSADHLVEVGPGSGANGGTIIAQGSVSEVERSSNSRIAGFLSGEKRVKARLRCHPDAVFENGAIELATGPIHTVKSLEVRIPRGRLTAVTGVSGSGKTTLVLEGLVPALRATIVEPAPTASRTATESRSRTASASRQMTDAPASNEARMPAHVRSIDAAGIRRVNLIDSTPIGANVRSTVATYSGVLDDLRRAYAATSDAKQRGLKMGAFSYNTGSLRCPTCDGTGSISLDVQFLPDVDVVCPDCGGSRYATEAYHVFRAPGKDSFGPGFCLPDLMGMTVDEALDATSDLKKAHQKLATLSGLGLGYLTLGEATPALSGGEAQRLKLASEMGRRQDDALFVFDEPTIGLHPLDVEVLLGVLERLVQVGATVVVIEHDLDMIANADYVIDLGPGGGEAGGRVVCAGTPEEVAACPQSITGRYLALH